MSFLDSLVVAIGLAVVLPLGILILTMSNEVLHASIGKVDERGDTVRPSAGNALFIIVQFVFAISIFVWITSHIFKMVTIFIN